MVVGTSQPSILTLQGLKAYELAPFLWKRYTTRFPRRKILMGNVLLIWRNGTILPGN